MDKLSHRVAWGILIDSEVLSGKYKYDAVDTSSWPAPTGLPGEGLSAGTFQPRTSAASTPQLRKFPGSGPPSWPTLWPPEQAHVFAEDAAVTRHAQDTNWGRVHGMWRAQLFVPGLVVKHSERGYFYSYGSLERAVLLWPAARAEISSPNGVVQFWSLQRLRSSMELWLAPLHISSVLGEAPPRRRIAH